MKVTKSKEIAAYIPTASMADIAFLLIIFFMVSSVFPIDKTQVDLPETPEVRQYSEDSAVIAITTDQLEFVREMIDRPLSEIYGKPETVRILGSDGVKESQELMSERISLWDMNDQNQFERLKSTIREFLRGVERRRETEGRAIIIVLKADSKVPFLAVDGVVQVLQDLGGEAAQGIAILSQPE